jgi:hypothetical protein
MSSIIQSETNEDQIEQDWLIRSIKFIVLGLSDPLKFLWELYYKFLEATKDKTRKNRRSYKILNRDKIVLL